VPVLRGARLVTPGGVVDGGWLAHDGFRITGLGAGSPPGAVLDGEVVEVVDLDGCWVLPGFVDLHCHGGGGHSFVGGDPDQAVQGAAFHRRHGTTTLLLGLVTGPLDRLADASGRLAGGGEAARRPDGSPGGIAGLHLEGPFLGEGACGAQDPRWMVDPTPEAVARLVEAGRGTLRMVTLAPERPGALDAIATLAEAGIVAALGHTTATWAQARAGIDAGATVATHLYNAMSPLHHREPGTVGAVLADPRIAAELILDGHHVHAAAATVAFDAKGPGGCALITDAIAAAGAADGELRLGDLAVTVRDGAARLASTGALAGSLLTMDAAVRFALDAGRPITEVAAMASTTPARLLGLAGTRGSLAAGKHADLVVLDDRHEVQAVHTADAG